MIINFEEKFSGPKSDFRSKFITWEWTPSNTFLDQKGTPAYKIFRRKDRWNISYEYFKRLVLDDIGSSKLRVVEITLPNLRFTNEANGTTWCVVSLAKKKTRNLINLSTNGMNINSNQLDYRTRPFEPKAQGRARNRHLVPRVIKTVHLPHSSHS